MLSNRFGLAILGGACVLAAGTGAYVATRNVTQPAPMVEPRKNASANSEPGPGQPLQEPVQETEAVLAPEAESAPAAALSEAAPKAAAPAEPARSRHAGAARPAARPSSRASNVRSRNPDGAGSRDVSESRSDSREPAVSSPDAGTTVRRTPRPADVESTPIGSERTRSTTMPLPRTEPVEQLPFPGEESPARDRESVRAARPLEELVVAADSVIGLQLDNTLSSETAQIEDRVSARVIRDVIVDGRVAIPAGSRVLGEVAIADRGGKMRERARLGVRFHTLVLADGTNIPIQTDTIYREGDSPSSASAAKIGGGAIGGAIIGGILGGAKGAIIGGTTGAAGGTAAVMAGGRKPATLTAGSTMTARVLSPITVTVDRLRN